MDQQLETIKQNSFFDLVRDRRSVRNFKSQPVDAEKLHQILESAILAPSAGNLQAYKIFSVTNKQKRQMVAKAALDQGFVADAPVLLLFCAVPELSRRYYGRRGAQLFALQDATIACSFAMLAASALNLGSVWVGAFDTGEIREALGLTEEFFPVALLAIGHPASQPERSSRRTHREMVCAI